MKIFKSRESSNKLRLLLLFLLCLIIALCFVFKSGYIKGFFYNNNSIVAQVKGYPIYEEELQQQVNNYRAEVFRYFSKKYKVQDSKDFWTTSFGGEVPEEMVRKKALDETIRIKVQQLLAKDYGLIKDISYLTFLKDLKAENRRRAKALKNNEIIYGPEQYGEAEYFSYVFTNMVIKLKDKLWQTQLKGSLDSLELDKNYEKMINVLVKSYMGTGY